MSDILVFMENSLDATFPTSQFLIERYSEPYHCDRNRNGGGVLTYVPEDIPSKPLMDHKLPHDIERIYVKIDLSKYKWLLGHITHLANQMSISLIIFKIV